MKTSKDTKRVNLFVDFGNQASGADVNRVAPFEGVVCSWWPYPKPIGQGRTIEVKGRWTCADRDGMRAYPFVYPVTLICHLLTGGPVGFVYLDDYAASDYQRLLVDEEFKVCKDNNKALVVEETFEGGKVEFLLAPIIGKRTDDEFSALQSMGKSKGVFGVYATSHTCGHFLLSRVIRKERIPLVLDLDETLVKAHTIAALEKKSDTFRESTKMDLSRAAKDCDNLLYTDKVWLSRFADEERLVLGKKEYKARSMQGMYQPSNDRGHTFQEIWRPVLDLQYESASLYDLFPSARNVFMTKVLSDLKHTSILGRVRPGWNDAYKLLMTGNTHDADGMAVEVFVATTAEKNYAHEIWRVLDIDSEMIPNKERFARITTDMKSGKTLSKCMTYLNANSLVNAMPLAIIIDDRLDVWDAESQKQVLKSDVYDPYDPKSSTPMKIEDQMKAFGDIIMQAREIFFSHLKQHALLLFDDSHPYKEYDLNNLENDYFDDLGGILNMSRILANIASENTNLSGFIGDNVPSLAIKQSNAARVGTPTDPRKRKIDSVDTFEDILWQQPSPVMYPNNKLPELAPECTVQTVGGFDADIFDWVKKPPAAANDIQDDCSLSDALSHDTITHTTRPHYLSDFSEQANHLASSLGLTITSKCEWNGAMNVATIIVSESGKDVIIGMCSGVDAGVAISSAYHAAIKYLENKKVAQELQKEKQRNKKIDVLPDPKVDSRKVLPTKRDQKGAAKYLQQSDPLNEQINMPLKEEILKFEFSPTKSVGRNELFAEDVMKNTPVALVAPGMCHDKTSDPPSEKLKTAYSKNMMRTEKDASPDTRDDTKPHTDVKMDEIPPRSEASLENKPFKEDSLPKASSVAKQTSKKPGIAENKWHCPICDINIYPHNKATILVHLDGQRHDSASKFLLPSRMDEAWRCDLCEEYLPVEGNVQDNLHLHNKSDKHLTNLQKPWHCKVCQKSYQSNHSIYRLIRAHKLSTEHLEKVAMIEKNTCPIPRTGSSWFCRICKCTTPDGTDEIIQRHKLGKTHRENLENLKDIMHEPQASRSSKEVPKEKGPMSKRESPEYTKRNEYKCKDCEISLWLYEHEINKGIRQHESTPKHKAIVLAKEKFKNIKDCPPWTCDSCGAVCRTWNNILAHLQGNHTDAGRIDKDLRIRISNRDRSPRMDDSPLFQIPKRSRK